MRRILGKIDPLSLVVVLRTVDVHLVVGHELRMRHVLPADDAGEAVGVEGGARDPLSGREQYFKWAPTKARW